MDLTAEEQDQIVRRSREAQAFLASDLYKELEKWIAKEEQAISQAITQDRRNVDELKMTRSEFVERKCGYFLALKVIPSVFKTWAHDQEELKKLVETYGQTDQSTDQE